jgi:hypothetical protein
LSAMIPPRQARLIRTFLTALLFLVPAISPLAQDSSESRPLRFDFTPFAGYRSSMTFPVDPHVTGTNPRVILDASPSYGFSFGMRLLPNREEDLVEVRWARQDSYLRTEEITPAPPLQRVVLHQFHGDFSHEPFIQDWPQWARPYVVASVGATHISAGSSISFTGFSFGIGGGIRFYPTRHLGFKLQAQWVPVIADSHVAFVCGAGCLLHVSGNGISQGEVFAGTFIRF